MPWFKIDDGFWSHPKILELSDEAIALWVRAGAYCAGHLTDGEVKRSTLRLLGATNDAATELVIAGLWDHSEGAWTFHDWGDYQPTREKVLAEREATRMRVEKHRQKQSSNGATHAVSTRVPSRPVPTRPLTDYVSQSDDRQTDEISRSVMRGLGVDPNRAVSHIGERTGREVTPDEALAIVTAILSRGVNVSKPQAYVLGAITREPAEIRALIDAGRPTTTPTRDPECTTHPGYPQPCHRCATSGQEGTP